MPDNNNIFSSELDQILEKIISRNFTSETELLNYFVQEIVNHKGLEILGGRLWKIKPEFQAYELTFQHGTVIEIELGFRQSLSDKYFYSELIKLQNETAISSEESNVELQKKGVKHYAMTGVGELIHLKEGKFFNYLIGLNANKYDEAFFSTLKVISRLMTIALRDFQRNKIDSKLNRELNQAADIQRKLLPENYLEFHDYKIFGVCLPDREIGGDFFDYIVHRGKDSEETIGVVICDCASKGLPAAIQSLFVSGAVRMGMGFAPKISLMLGKLNNLIHRTFSRDRFVTLFYGELTLSSNRLILYANAGHCSPIHYRPEKDKFQELDPTGSFLGIELHQKFNIENCRMFQGDILVLFTDGISEAQNSKGELYGSDRIKNVIRNNKNLEAKEIAYMLLEDVQKFSVNSIYNDDKTIVVIKRDKRV